MRLSIPLTAAAALGLATMLGPQSDGQVCLIVPRGICPAPVCVGAPTVGNGAFALDLVPCCCAPGIPQFLSISIPPPGVPDCGPSIPFFFCTVAKLKPPALIVGPIPCPGPPVPFPIPALPGLAGFSLCFQKICTPSPICPIALSDNLKIVIR